MIMPGARYGLEVSETILTNPEETDKVTISGSSNDISNSGVSTVSEDGIKTLLKVCNCLV